MTCCPMTHRPRATPEFAAPRHIHRSATRRVREQSAVRLGMRSTPEREFCSPKRCPAEIPADRNILVWVVSAGSMSIPAWFAPKTVVIESGILRAAGNPLAGIEAGAGRRQVSTTVKLNVLRNNSSARSLRLLFGPPMSHATIALYVGVRTTESRIAGRTTTVS